MSSPKEHSDMIPDALKMTERYARLEMSVKGIPGLALSVTDDEGALGTVHLGLADVGTRRPVTRDTLFQIGSISKSFTCIALLQLVDEGKLDLDAPVKEYLPEFKVKSRFRPITLHHLMTHSAGIVGGALSTPEMWSEMHLLNGTEATLPPGKLFNYSNAGYEVLGLLLERMTGRTFEQVIRSRILDPVGMHDTSPVTAEHLRGVLAEGYEPYYDDRPPQFGGRLSQAFWLPSSSGAGSICSTAEDMALYVRMLLNHGEACSRRIVSEESFGLMTKGYIKSDDPSGIQRYGYGLTLSRKGPRTIVGHTGSTVGYRAEMTIDMTNRLGCVVLTNGPRRFSELSGYVLRAARASKGGRRPPSIPTKAAYFTVKGPSAYAGTYSSEAMSFQVVPRRPGIAMRLSGKSYQLQPTDDGSFVSSAPGFELYPITFKVRGSKVLRASYGPEEFARAPARARRAPVPLELARFVGHYRATNPWLTNFRVFYRSGGLHFSNPQDGAEVPLTKVSEACFAMGRNKETPERLRFHDVVSGKAMRVELSGSQFYRAFTP